MRMGSICVQVDPEGQSWRSGAVVEKRKLKQWFFKITDFAEVSLAEYINLRSRVTGLIDYVLIVIICVIQDLLRDLDHLDRWPDRVKQMQKHWIGKSKGAEFQFEVVCHHVLIIDSAKCTKAANGLWKHLIFIYITTVRYPLRRQHLLSLHH